MGALSPTHWLIIVGVVVLLFGAKKLPDFARSMGQSMRIIKAETSELRSHTPAAVTARLATAPESAPITAHPAGDTLAAPS